MCVYIYIYVYIYIFMRVRVYTCVYIGLYTCVYVYMLSAWLNDIDDGIRIYKDQLIDLVGRVLTNDPGDLDSIPGRVIPKTLRWYLILPCLTLSNIRYVSRVKWSNPEKWIVSSSTPRCRSYWKGSLLVALDYGRQLYFTLYIYIYI